MRGSEPATSPICPGCGAIAVAARNKCELCQQSLPQDAPRAASRPDGRYWVALRCEFQCRACGFLSPLNFLAVDGAIDCLRCGIRQAFAAESWVAALDHAQAVGDLCSPQPGSRRPRRLASIAARNPYRTIGVTQASAKLHLDAAGADQDKRQKLHVVASPGHPLCRRCHGLLDATVCEPGVIDTSCRTCGEQARYAIPPAVLHLCPGCCGALASEHRTDAATVAFDEPVQGGAIALRCPTCSAPLRPRRDSAVIVCSYCQTAARIPHLTLQRAFGGEVQAELWWVLFSGPSRLRRKLEGRALETAPEQSPRRRWLRGNGFAGPHSALAKLAAMVVVVLLTLTGLAFVVDRNPSGRGPGLEPAATAFTEIPSCTCDDGRERLRLAVSERSAKNKASVDLAHELRGAGRSRVLDATSQTAPPARAHRRPLELGLACSAGVAVLAWGNRASAWRLHRSAPLWTTRLPRPMLVHRNPLDRRFTVNCLPLRQDQGLVHVPVGRQRSLALRIADGLISR